MKLLQYIPLFMMAVSAAKYSAGTVCHTSKECNENCHESNWTTMTNEGDSQFVCVSTAPNPTEYFVAACRNHKETRNRVVYYHDKAKTKTACEAFGGALCDNYCLFKGKRVDANDMQQKWTNACRATGGVFVDPHFYTKATAELALAVASCPNKGIFDSA